MLRIASGIGEQLLERCLALLVGARIFIQAGFDDMARYLVKDDFSASAGPRTQQKSEGSGIPLRP
jgi:hypothetical protein